MSTTNDDRKSVLFVGSANRFLDATPHGLFGEGRSYRARLVSDIVAASALLEHERFDMLVLAPNAGDAWPAFLAEVRRTHPQMARALIANRRGREESSSSTSSDAYWLAHCVLASDSDRRALRSALSQVADLQDLLRSAKLEPLLTRLDRLPSANRVFARLICEASRPTTSARDLARIVETDVALCARVLQMVNSSYFGLGRRIASVHQAVSYLGTAMMRALAMAAQLYAMLDGTPLALAAVMETQRHGLMTARLAAMLCERRSDVDLVLSAGLLHDVGKLALLYTARRDSIHTSTPSHSAADDVGNVSHAVLGGYLTRLWGLPDEICEVVAFHHTPRRAGRTEPSALTLVHIADALVARELDGKKFELDMPYLNKVGVTSRLPAWEEVARSFFEVNARELRPLRSSA